MPHGAKTLQPRGYRRPPALSSAKRGYGYQHRKLREETLKRFPICFHCGQRPSTERDHIVPLSRGGADTIENSVGSCKTCNVKRRSRTRA